MRRWGGRLVVTVPVASSAAVRKAFVAWHRRHAAEPCPSELRPGPRKLADQIGAIRDLVTKAPAAWSVEQVAGAFRGANKGDVEEVLDSLAALGMLAGYEAEGARRWKVTRPTA